MKKFIIREWNSAGKYFFENLKQTYYIFLGLFVAFVIINVMLFQNNPQTTEVYYKELVTLFQGKDILNNTGLSLWFWIFINNLWAGGLTIAAGFIPFLFLPIFSLLSNATIVGLIGAVYQIDGVGWIPFLAGILPHGIIEIPALILSVTLGVHICYVLVKTVTKKNFKGELKQAILASLQIFFLWIIPLFIVAAFIESFMTPIIFNAFV